MVPKKVPNPPQPTPQALAAMLKQNKALKELWLDGNDLGDLGAEALLPKPPEGMGFGGRVVEVEVRGKNCSREEIGALGDSLRISLSFVSDVI